MGTYDIKFDDGERKRGVKKSEIKGGTKYYGGEVTRVNDDGTYDIKFDDGERKRDVKTSEIKGGKDFDDECDYDDRRSKRSKSPKKKSSTGKKIRRGDRVEAKSKRMDKYYSGEVTRVNDD